MNNSLKLLSHICCGLTVIILTTWECSQNLLIICSSTNDFFKANVSVQNLYWAAIAKCLILADKQQKFIAQRSGG
jgi:hypothetical protein